MTYSVKEMFATLQGEGAQAGRAAIFIRFAGCNLWTGREQDRASAICQFCDTDFIGTNGEGGAKFKTAQALAEAIKIFEENENGFDPDDIRLYAIPFGRDRFKSAIRKYIFSHAGKR